MLKCAECNEPIESRDKGWDTPDGGILCMGCFRQMGQKMFASSAAAATGDAKKLLRKWAKEEYADLVPYELLKETIEAGMRRIFSPKSDVETEIGGTARRVQFMTALQIEEAKAGVVRALRDAINKGLDELEREALDNMRRLRDLGAQG